MANKFDNIKAFILANPTTASWWIEEVVFRGAPGVNGGIIKGASFSARVLSVQPDGSTVDREFGPFPVNNLPSGSTMAQTIGAIQVSQQSTIDQQTQTIADRDATVAQQVSTIAARDATIAQQTTDLAERDASINDLNAQLATAQASIADKDATIVTRDARIAELEAQLAALATGGT